VVIVSLAMGFISGIELTRFQARERVERLQESLPAFKRPDKPVVFDSLTQKKLVALTFDDGPDPRFTPKILRILKNAHVKATFFVVGISAKDHPNLIKQAARAGNLIENHTWDHPEFELLGSLRMAAELEKTSKLIARLTGARPKYFRPPHGILTRKIYLVAAHEGYRLIMWSNALQERRFSHPKSDAAFIAARIEPGAIILAHDGRLDHSRGVAALPTLIKTLKARGYRFVTLDQLPLPSFK